MVVVLLLGWLEDLAIGQSPRLSPFANRADGPKDRPRRRSALLAWPSMMAGVAVAILITALVFPADSAPLVSRPRTAVPAAPRSDAGGEAAESRLPRRVVVGYWQGWGGPFLRLRDVPPAYNVVLAAFATGDATGKIAFSQSVQSKSSFIDDIEALNKAHRPVLLSVGGWDDGGLKITTDVQRRAFVNSASKIIDTYHFRGIDWDLEHGIDPVQVAQATRDLKSRYGRDFIVTMAPLLEQESEVQQLELAARIADVLDLASPQFYNYGTVDPSWIVDRTLAWGRVVGGDKVAMGFMTVDTPSDTGEQSPDGGVPNLAAVAGQSSQRPRCEHLVDQSGQGIWLRLRQEMRAVRCSGLRVRYRSQQLNALLLSDGQHGVHARGPIDSKSCGGVGKVLHRGAGGVHDKGGGIGVGLVANRVRRATRREERLGSDQH